MRRWVILGLTVTLVAGCATGAAMRRGRAAADRGDHDAAVAHYREALRRDPNAVDIRIALERATRAASAEHVKRARELEAQDQLAGALAEYKLAADLDVSNTFALTKAVELERRMREQLEATRPKTRMERLREDPAVAGQIRRLHPRAPLSFDFSAGSVQQALQTVSDLTGINITYDQDPNLKRRLDAPYSIKVSNQAVEDVLNQILTANAMVFKITNQDTIFIYEDTPNKRQQYDDVYVQNFYLSHVEVTEINQIINQMITQGVVIRPAIAPNKNVNAISVRATLPVLQAIQAIIEANDKPRAEVMVEAEILEVNRRRIKELGIDLSRYALGFTFSPELAPPNTSPPAGFPSEPPPFNVNTISRGASAADVYLTVPTALIDLLESDASTKVLAKTQLRGREGSPMNLRLGDLIPLPTGYVPIQTGIGGAAQFQTQVTYTPVGVNLLFTPRVTFQDEIIIDSLTLQNTGIGANITVADQEYPTTVDRTATTSLRLRDGESNMIAGLLRDQDRVTTRGLPGLMSIPGIRQLFGHTSSDREQTDIVMIITPRIIRSHELRPEDLAPIYVGTSANFGATRVPSLIGNGPGAAPATVGLTGELPPGALQTTPPGGAQTPPPAGAKPPETPPAGGAKPTVVPIQPVGETGAAPKPAGPARIVATVGGEQQASGPPFTVPLTIENVTDVNTVSVSIAYNPQVLQAASVSQGSFLAQGGVQPAFVPKIDAQSGRVEIAIARPSGGASGATGLLASIQFRPLTAGTSPITISAVVNGADGKPITVQTVPATVVVK
jgi:general secretion pathway protein D